MTVTTTRRANRLRLIDQPGHDTELRAYRDLESQINDVNRAARIAFMMTMHDLQNEDEERLGLRLFAVEQVERLAAELRESFYAISESKAVRS